MCHLNNIGNIIQPNKWDIPKVQRYLLSIILVCATFLPITSFAEDIIEYNIPIVKITEMDLINKIDSTLSVVLTDSKYNNGYNAHMRSLKYNYVCVHFSSAQYLQGVTLDDNVNLNDSLGTYILISATNRPLGRISKNDESEDHYFAYKNRQYLFRQGDGIVLHKTGRMKKVRASRYLDVISLIGTQYIFFYKKGQLSVVTDENVLYGVNE